MGACRNCRYSNYEDMVQEEVMGLIIQIVAIIAMVSVMAFVIIAASSESECVYY